MRLFKSSKPRTRIYIANPGQIILVNGYAYRVRPTDLKQIPISKIGQE